MQGFDTIVAKCDFCEKEATCFGSHQCYAACDDHVKNGEKIEDKMFEEFAKGQERYLDQQGEE